MLVQALVAEPAIEALDVRILDGLAGTDEAQTYSSLVRPGIEHLSFELRPIAQVRGTYGDAEAQTLVENCGNTLMLRCSASERGGTAEFASRLIGQREVIRPQVSRPASFLGSGAARSPVTRTDQHVTEDAVMASEIEQLPDFTGFLKLASRPEWMRVVLPPQAVC